MATELRPDGPEGPGGGSGEERWQRLWSHREQLLKVARRRSMSDEDAEDAVHEAMLRALERPDLEEERLGAWLTTVTVRLCVDRYRQVRREAELLTRSSLAAPGPVPVEEAVCDRAEARWVAGRSGELPARQAEALRLRSEDLDVEQVADKMGLSYRAVESLLARARRTLRHSLAATLALACGLLGRVRLRSGGSGQAVAAASTMATLAVVGLALPAGSSWQPGGGDGSRPVRAPAARTVSRPGAGHPGHRAHPAVPVGSGRPARGRAQHRRTGGAAPVSHSPAASPSALPTAEPSRSPAPGVTAIVPVPSVPVPSVSTTLPSLPVGVRVPSAVPSVLPSLP